MKFEIILLALHLSIGHVSIFAWLVYRFIVIEIFTHSLSWPSRIVLRVFIVRVAAQGTIADSLILRMDILRSNLLHVIYISFLPNYRREPCFVFLFLPQSYRGRNFTRKVVGSLGFDFAPFV